MNTYYTDEVNVQIVISLLKQHGIRKVIASPGGTNITFVASIQQDPWFEIYSAVDERSAAYMACGLSAESGEPVVINCTGATSSRNYMPAMTEAYYRKLPIIAITSSQVSSKVGQLVAQVTDRTSPPKDTVKYTANISIVKDNDDIWDCEIKVNNALLEIKRNGGGPVHLNVETKYSKNYDVKELPKYRKIERFTISNKLPELSKGKIGVFIGSHVKMTNRQIEAIDRFCETNNAVAFCDHTSSYRGRFAVLSSLLFAQNNMDKSTFIPELLIHIGEISGDYSNLGSLGNVKEVWRVNTDGEIHDTFRKLRYVYEMSIESFFEHYVLGNKKDNSYHNLCCNKVNELRTKIPTLPLSNVWVASQIANKLPQNSTVHFAILNSLRSWNFFELPESVTSVSNVGGFGIDGCTSSLIGASLANPDKLYYLITGDLAFFYDINVLGNRHIGRNVRILLINNGLGKEFTLHKCQQEQAMMINKYIGAAKHNGDKSQLLIKNLSENLGYEYLTASSKDDFNKVYERFIAPELTYNPIIFEIFINSIDETEAYDIMISLESSIGGKLNDVIRTIIGAEGMKAVKSIYRK